MNAFFPIQWIRCLSVLLFLTLGLCLTVRSQAGDTLLLDKQMDSLDKAWNGLLSQGKYAEVMPMLESFRQQVASRIGTENIPYARVLNFRGIVHFYLQQWSGAESDYRDAMEIRKRLQGASHNSVAMGMNNLAYLYMVRDRFEEAEQLYKDALALRERVVGKRAPDYAWSLNNLGILYYNTARYEECEPLFREALEIRAVNPGKQHPAYAGSLNNLATLYMNMGRYESAEPLFQEALAIKEKTKGKETPDYCSSLENLATLYQKLGRYREAEKCFLESRRIKEKILRNEDPDYASLLINLGNLYRDMGERARAESCFLETLGIREKVFGPENMEVAQVLINLATLYLDTGRSTRADTLLVRAQTIVRKAVGPEHDDYADVRAMQARIWRERGDEASAETALLEARGILERRFGKRHPRYRALLFQLAELYEQTGRYRQSEALYRESFEIQRSQLRVGAAFLSESELSDYVRSFQSDHSGLLASTLRRIRGKQDASALTGICYDNALFNKGFLQDAANQVNTVPPTDTGSLRLQHQLKSIRRRLAEQYALTARERDTLLVQNLEAAANQVEKDLVSRIARFRESTRDVSWQEVQSRLKPGEAAVEFLCYASQTGDVADSTWYVALLLKPGMPAPMLVPLFEGSRLYRLLFQGQERRLDYVNQMYTFADRGAIVVSGRDAGLPELVWSPLAPNLDGIQTIYLSPAGLLHLVNLAAIPVSEEEVLADRYELVSLGSTRKLATAARSTGSAKSAVLFGGVVYDADSSFLALHEINAGQELAIRSAPQASGGETVRPGERWSYLKWTEKEVRSLKEILEQDGYQTKWFSGSLATEESFKSLAEGGQAPFLVHLATHGFFFPDPGSRKPDADSESAFKVSANPLIRSGLLLSGANHAWTEGHSISRDVEDGILTAYEISQMDLSGTQLVILSACETGLGDLEGSEGVYGLQRAFKIAGVRYLIMSLWQVPDKQTSMLMTAFYRKWLEDKQSIPQAFQSAQKELRDLGLDPYYWAGFVLVE